MPPRPIQTIRVNPRSQQPPDPDAMRSSLSLLRDWREGSVATAIVIAALLPFAVAWHVSYLIAILASLIVAMILALGCHAARQRRLTTLAVFPEFAQLPELASKRERLLSTHNRRKLADGLRRAAASTQPPRRFDCCPVLPDRVAAVRPALHQLAAALEHSADPDPASVALIHELLTNACSPLYNPNLPAEDLPATLVRALAGMTAQPPRSHARTQ
jgi:hypothetical protein